MKYLVYLTVLYLIIPIDLAFSSDCVPRRVVLEAEFADDMMYVRTHPSGRYLIYTRPGERQSGQSVLVDLFDLDENNKVRQISTNLNGESYPVEPSWDYISAPYHKNGMDYVPFDDLLLFGPSARPAFSDNEHDEWYQSVAELPGGRDNDRTFRTLLYGGQRTREYKVNKQQGEYSVEKSEVFKLCSETIGNENSRKKDHDSFVKKQAELAEAYYNAKTENERKSIREQARQVQSDLAAIRYFSLDGSLDQPILSKDGTEVAGNVGGQTRVFSIIDRNKCKEVENLGNLNSKVSFSYPVNGKSKYITYNKYIVFESSDSGSYSGRSASVVFDRENKEEIILYDINQDTGSGSYPNFTKDGRVIFVQSGNVVIVDPNQYKDGEGSSSCVKRRNLPAGTPEVLGGIAKTGIAPAPKSQKQTN